jgi:NTE family protein
MQERPRFGLALSGGTARSIAHLGVLQLLDREGLRPDVITATSGGSLIGVLYAAGLDHDTLQKLAVEVNWRKLARVRMPRLGLLSNQGIEQFVIDAIGDAEFEDLRIPTYVIATDLLQGDKKVFSTGPVARAVRASCSIPQIFSPVEIEGGLYADGGFVEYMPVETARELGCEVVAGVNLSRYSDFSEPPGNLLAMIHRMVGIIAKRNGTVSAEFADCLIEPDLRGFGSFDLGRAEDLIAAGQAATRAMLPRLQELLEPPHAKGIPALVRRLLGRAA